MIPILSHLKRDLVLRLIRIALGHGRLVKVRFRNLSIKACFQLGKMVILGFMLLEGKKMLIVRLV